ncbi:MAG: hypothetical protein ABIP51_05470 [Bacteroidia bacterium]
MEQSIKENRAETFSPVYKEYNQDLNAFFDIDKLISEMLSSKKVKTIYCNSLFAEETINVIIGYFNEQTNLNNSFKHSVLNEIENIEFAYSTDNKKLAANIEINSENSLIASANGMKNILEAFIRYSDFTSDLNNNSFEEIEYVTEPASEAHDSSKIWVAQTIDEPWFK